MKPTPAAEIGEETIDLYVRLARFKEGDITLGLLISLRMTGVCLKSGDSEWPGSSSLGML